MRSIMQAEPDRCYICGRTGNLQKHHCIHGTANRRLADEDGLFVWLCPDCHLYGKNAVHRNRAVDLALEQTAQKTWETYYTGDFRERYGKNYLEDET